MEYDTNVTMKLNVALNHSSYFRANNRNCKMNFAYLTTKEQHKVFVSHLNIMSMIIIRLNFINGSNVFNESERRSMNPVDTISNSSRDMKMYTMASNKRSTLKHRAFALLEFQGLQSF